MSKHRQYVETTPPAIFGSPAHRGQVVGVDTTDDHVLLSLTPEAATELARLVVQYGSTVRTNALPAPSAHYDPALWHDVGLALHAAVLRGAPRRVTAAVSRYLAPRQRSQAPVVSIGVHQ